VYEISYSASITQMSDLKVYTRTQLILVTEHMKNACGEDKTAHISTLFTILFLHFLAFLWLIHLE